MPIVNQDFIQQFTAINLLSDPGHIPGPVVIPNVWQARLNWGQSSGKVAYNVLHLRVTPGKVPSAAMANAILSAVQALVTSSGLGAHLGNDSSLFNVDLRDLSPPGNNPIVSGVAGALIGTSTNISMPQEVAVVLTLRTNFTGQANRGRVYIPNFSHDSVGTGNVILPAAVTALNSFASGFQSAMQTGGNFLCIAQPARQAYTGKSGRQHPARGAGSIDVTSVILRDNHFDTVRRRGLK